MVLLRFVVGFFAVSHGSLMHGLWFGWKNSPEISTVTACLLISGSQVQALVRPPKTPNISRRYEAEPLTLPMRDPMG
jgi:hypothetical protein